MTIKMAELESQRSSSNYNDQVSLLHVSSVFGHAICLSLLIKNMDFNLHSIPQDIANTMFDVNFI